MCGAARQWYQGRVSSRAARASVMMSAMCGYNIHRVLIHYAVHIITLYTVHSVMMRNDCTYAVYSICTVKSLRCVQRNDVWHTSDTPSIRASNDGVSGRLIVEIRTQMEPQRGGGRAARRWYQGV